MSRRIWYAIIFLFSTSAAAGSGNANNFRDRLALIEKTGLSDAFREVVVKVDRPMPWGVFVRDRYRLLKGNGDAAGGDLGEDADAAIWLAILDQDYRRDGHLIYVEGGSVPGLAEDRWLSLSEFEADVMPAVVHHPGSFAGGDVERAVKELVSRATALHKLSWYGLLLVPGPEATGWRPLNPEDPLWRWAQDIDRAYAQKDTRAMRLTVSALGTELKRLPGYPARAKLTLEMYLAKFAVMKVGLALYVASALMFLLRAAFGGRGFADAGAWTAGIGFGFVTVALAGRSVIAAHLPVAGGYEILSLLSWSVVLFFIVFYLTTREPFLGVTLMALSAAIAIAASLFPARIETPLAPSLRSWWYAAHAALPAIGGGAFAVGFAASLGRLFTSKPTGVRPGFRGSLREIESRAFGLGYPVVAVGALVAGAVWAQRARAAWWRWGFNDAVWLVPLAFATVYLHIGRKTREERFGAVLAILTFTAAVCALVVNAVLSGSELGSFY
jgi:ABC-type transport system involved in cytochrome c biogenesis permease subunit